MAIRTTVDIPDSLHSRLRERAKTFRIFHPYPDYPSLEQTYVEPKKGKLVTGLMVACKGKPGPDLPVDENPHEQVFF